MEKTVCILAGARPNFVKVSPLVRAVDNLNDGEAHTIVGDALVDLQLIDK